MPTLSKPPANPKRPPTPEELVELQAYATLSKRMKAAAATGNIAEAKACIPEGISLDARSKPGGPCALTIAAKAGHTHFVLWGLCELHGPIGFAGDPVRDALVRNCADAAATQSHIDTLEMLCQFGADMNCLGSHGLSAVEMSLRLDLPELFSFAAPKWIPGSCDHPILQAIQSLKQPMREAWTTTILGVAKPLAPGSLLAHGSKGLHALGAAADNGLIELIGPLCAFGGGIDEPSTAEGMTPLMLAVKHPECAKLLVQLGANTQLRCAKGWTALRHAMHERCLETSKILHPVRGALWWTGKGPSLLWSAVCMVVENGTLDPEASSLLCKVILELPPKDIARDDDSNRGVSGHARPNIAGACIAYGLRDCFAAVLSLGVDPNLPNSHGITPLGQACVLWPRHNDSSQIEGVIASLDWACSFGADPSCVDSSGRDLLQAALAARACPALLHSVETRLDMKAKRRLGWSTLTEMILAGYNRLEHFDAMAPIGSALDEISEWMQASGAARGADKHDLAKALLTRALVCREKHELLAAAPAPATAHVSPKLGRL